MSASSGTIPRRSFRGDAELSVVGFGGIVVIGMEQADANDAVAEAVRRGVNYFDVGPNYGDGEAEEKLGPALEPFRDEVFVACKSSKRHAEGVREELERSLKRLRTDHFDLYQFHAVKTLGQVERILSPGGAAEVFLEAREAGKVKYLGLSAHTEEAALALMDRINLDSVMFPVNYVCWSQSGFGPRVLERAEEKGMARLALKSLAYAPWREGEERTHPKCWYKPVSSPELVEKALHFTLSRGVTAAVSPSHADLLKMALDAAEKASQPMSKEEEKEVLGSATGVTPIFPTD